MMTEWLDADWILNPGEAPLQYGRLGIDKDAGKLTTLTTNGASAGEKGSGTTFMTPGLINAHTHLEMYAPEPIALEAGESMAHWLLKVIDRTRQMSDTVKRLNCQKSILEMIRTGTTCVNDITSSGASLEALSTVGMRGVVSPEFFYPFHGETPDVSNVVERFESLKARFADHPLLSLGISPHSPYNVTLQAWAAVVKAIDPALVHTHLAETEAEMTWFSEGASSLDEVHEKILGKRFGPTISGTTPVQAVASLMDPRWVAAHGIYLEPTDVAVLQATGVSLVTCPRSNMHLSGKTLPDYRKLLASGLTLGLGTDSRFSCPDLDLRAEGRAARERHGLSAEETLALMTMGSAQAIKRPDLGRLDSGKTADLVLWWHPSENIEDPAEAWLSPQTEALMVMINGRIVLERCLDELVASVG